MHYSQRLPIQDSLKGFLRGHTRIQRVLREHLREQNRQWPRPYNHGYFYQGLEELSITGVKPTAFRFRQYQVQEILNGAEVLDIGSNCGFVAAYCARTAKQVTGIELNPFLNNIARDSIKYLGIDNVEIIEGDFAAYETSRKFDVVLSLSNHHTTDGNLGMNFEDYIAKVSFFLNPSGYLLFESHNVFAKGTGGAGDDGDMEAKIAIMSRWFAIERFRMVRCFLRHGVDDLDKLFIVARKSEEQTVTKFSLPDALKKYDW